MYPALKEHDDRVAQRPGRLHPAVFGQCPCTVGLTETRKYSISSMVISNLGAPWASGSGWRSRRSQCLAWWTGEIKSSSCKQPCRLPSSGTGWHELDDRTVDWKGSRDSSSPGCIYQRGLIDNSGVKRAGYQMTSSGEVSRHGSWQTDSNKKEAAMSSGLGFGGVWRVRSQGVSVLLGVRTIDARHDAPGIAFPACARITGTQTREIPPSDIYSLHCKTKYICAHPDLLRN